jgi:hypothetical protein
MANVLRTDKKIGDPAKPTQHVTVLHVPPVVSPITAVRAFIVQEFRNANPAQA